MMKRLLMVAVLGFALLLPGMEAWADASSFGGTPPNGIVFSRDPKRVEAVEKSVNQGSQVVTHVDGFLQFQGDSTQKKGKAPLTWVAWPNGESPDSNLELYVQTLAKAFMTGNGVPRSAYAEWVAKGDSPTLIAAGPSVTSKDSKIILLVRADKKTKKTYVATWTTISTNKDEDRLAMESLRKLTFK